MYQFDGDNLLEIDWWLSQKRGIRQNLMYNLSFFLRIYKTRLNEPDAEQFTKLITY